MTPLICTRERIAQLWAQLADFGALRHQMGMGTADEFLAALQDRHTLLFEDGDAMVIARDVVPRQDASVYFLACDHSLAGKEPRFHDALGYLFSVLGLQRVTAYTPDDMVVLVKLVGRLGFQWEGVKRRGWVWGEQVGDVHINGLLREEWDAGRTRRAA